MLIGVRGVFGPLPCRVLLPPGRAFVDVGAHIVISAPVRRRWDSNPQAL